MKFHLTFKKMRYLLLIIFITFFFHCAVTETGTTGKYVPPPEEKPSETKEVEVIEKEKVELPAPVKEKVLSEKLINYKIQIFASSNKEISEYEAKKVLLTNLDASEIKTNCIAVHYLVWDIYGIN